MKVKNIIILMQSPVYAAGILAFIWWIEGLKHPHLWQSFLWPIILLIQGVFRKKRQPRVKRTGFMDFSRAEIFSVLIVFILIGAFFLLPHTLDKDGRILRDGSWWNIPVMWAIGSIAGISLTVLSETIEVEEQERRRRNAEAMPSEA